MKKLERNATLHRHHFVDINRQNINVPEIGRWTHLQFRRYSGCAMCNLHIQEIIQRRADINAASIQEVIFFQSSEEDLQAQFPDRYFAIIADANGHYYRQFGVQTSVMSVLNPKSWIPAFTGLFKFGIKLPKKGESPLGLPADFLIDEEGKIVAMSYGKHAYDQWSVDHLLNLVKHDGVPV